MYMCVYKYIYIYVCVCIYIYVCVCMCIEVFPRIIIINYLKSYNCLK